MSLSAKWQDLQARRRTGRWQDGRHHRGDDRYARLRWTCATAAALGIFALDTFTSLSSAIAVLYILVLVAVGTSPSKFEILRLSGICVVLTVVSFLADHSLVADPSALLRVSFSVLAIVVTTSLLIHNLDTRQRHEAQAHLLDQAADAIVLRDPEGHVLLWNQGAARLYGAPRSVVMGTRHHDMLDSRFDVPRKQIDDMLEHDGYWNGEIQQTRTDGTLLTVSSRWTLQRDDTGAPWGILEISTDITERRAADRALDKSERRYRSIFHTLAVAVLEFDFTEVRTMLDEARASGVSDLSRHLADDAVFLKYVRSRIRVVNANPKALVLMGLQCRDRFLDRYCNFLPLSDEDLRSCLLALETGDILFEREVTAPGPEGASLSLRITLHFPHEGEANDHIQCSMVDLTEHKQVSDDLARTRSDLEHAMRITSIGEVSGTIAHEVNQPLAAIRANVEAAQRWLTRGPDHIRQAMNALAEVAAAAAHAGDIVKGVRRLLSRSEREDLPIGIDEMIKDAARLVRLEVLDNRTELLLDLDGADSHVMGDRLLLQQALVNLATNALQALQGAEGARMLTISSSVEGQTAIITARDNGPGFAPEIIENALEAFASTKRGGMGLGLAICRSAVEAHGGTVRIGNHEEGGAIVEMRLPLAS
ncbi:PAS domain-containing sensor histidine kinase [Sphingomonas sp. UYP23]